MNVRGLMCGLALSCGLLAVSANAATPEQRADKPFADADHVIYSLPSGSRLPLKSLLTNHGGGVLVQARVVFLFWGPSFNNAASPDYSYARTLQADRNQLGTSPEWAVLQEYGVNPTNLGAGTPDWFDTSAPPTNVTDSTVQAEVNRYLASHAYNSSTVYEVVIPKTSYSSSGSSTSCGGPALAYCAYHGSYNNASGAVIYSIQPYPSCSGCKASGWSDVQNQEHFFCHETREAATDPVNGWWDGRTGEEADDKCAWSPAPFLGTGGYACQYEWSNRANGCIKTR
ncbi:MAG TPA: hypothetical protein VGH73_11745 [Thermoanaerobaculia bacterium]